jgi:hypothetical protein
MTNSTLKMWNILIYHNTGSLKQTNVKLIPIENENNELGDYSQLKRGDFIYKIQTYVKSNCKKKSSIKSNFVK